MGEKSKQSCCPSHVHEKLNDLAFPYGSIIGSLMYVFMCTRPDLAFPVNILSRFQSNLAKNHLEGVKQVMRYLKTKSFCLTYQASDLKLISYFDSDYEGCVDTRKSISDFIFVFGGGAIS